MRNDDLARSGEELAAVHPIVDQANAALAPCRRRGFATPNVAGTVALARIHLALFLPTTRDETHELISRYGAIPTRRSVLNVFNLVWGVRHGLCIDTIGRHLSIAV